MSPVPTCPACAEALPERARFCPACGRSLTPLELGARRVVTVLFADLAGFTALAEGRDPEAVKDLLDECFGAMVPVIEDFGGTVDKIIGDELMAVFGVPSAHEDDPTRAVRAAIRLVSVLEASHPELVLRVGVNTGEVLAGPVGPSGANTVTGDTVNTAHRLVSVAGPGEVLVGERTQEASARDVRFETRPPFELRGKAQPVRAFAAVAERSRGGRPAEVGGATELVGRDAALRTLADAADRSARERHVEIVEVLGEAGIGKTRLAVELHRRLVRARSTRVLWGRGLPYGALDPWQPLGEALRPVFGVDHLDTDSARRRLEQRVGELISGGREPNRVGLARLSELLGVSEPAALPAGSGPARARRLDEHAAVCRSVLEALAADRPLVLVIDDAQWIDEQLRDFLVAIRTWPDAPATVLLLSREPVFEDPGASEVGRIMLGPLDDTAAGELVVALLRSVHDEELGEVVVGPAVERRILDAAGGNPFLLEQMVRYLIDRRALVSAEGRWEVASDFAEIGLPATARAMIDARVDALDPDQRRLLQHASVFGTTFEPDRVARLARVDPEEAEALVAGLAERGLLIAANDAEHVRFVHAVVRDSVYASMALGDRADKHAEIASSLSAADTVAPDDVGPIAHHVERALTYDHELGRPPSIPTDRAFALIVRAADDARRREAEREAERWYRQAAAIGSGDAAEAQRVALAHADVLTTLRRYDAAIEVLSTMLAQPGVPPAHRAEATTRLAVCHELAGRPDEASAAFAAARRTWRLLGDPLGEALGLRLTGWADLVAGRPRSALPKLLQAADLETEAGVPDPETLQNLGWCQYLLGDIEEARRNLWRAAETFLERDDVGGIGWCLGVLGFSFWVEGRISQAANIAESLSDEAARRSDPWSEAMCLTLLAACRAEAGDVHAASEALDRASRIFAEVDDPWGRAMIAVIIGMVHRIRGDHDGARVALEAGVDVARSHASIGEEARLLAELASLELDAGEDVVSVSHATRALDLVRSGIGDRDSEMRALLVLARERRRSADLEAARRLVEEAIDLGRDSLPTSAWRRACAHLAMIAGAQGDPVESRRAADHALDGAAESVRTWTLAKRADAAALLADGNADRAAATLRDVLDRLGDSMLAFVEPVRQDLERVRALSSVPD